jgi:hypothetical protein
MTLHQTIVAAWMQMAVLSPKNPERKTLLSPLPNKRETYFVDFSTVELVLYRGKWKLLETCNNSKSSLHYVITRARLCMSVHKFLYKPNRNALFGKLPPSVVNKVPVVVVFSSMIPQYRSRKNLGN